MSGETENRRGTLLTFAIGDCLRVDLNGNEYVGQVYGRYAYGGSDYVVVSIYMVVDHIDFLIPVRLVKAVVETYRGPLTELPAKDLLGKNVGYHCPERMFGTVIHVFPQYCELPGPVIFIIADPLNTREVVIMRNECTAQVITDPAAPDGTAPMWREG